MEQVSGASLEKLTKSAGGKAKFRGVVEDIKKILKQIESSPFAEGYQSLSKGVNKEKSNEDGRVDGDILSSQFLLKLCLKLKSPDDLKSFSLVNKKWMRMHGNIKRSIKLFEWDFLESGRMKKRFPNLVEIDLSSAWNSKKRESDEYENYISLTQNSLQMKIFLDSKFPEKYDLKNYEEQNELFLSLQKALLFISEDYPKLQKLTFVDFHGHFSEEILAKIFESKQKRTNNLKLLPQSPSYSPTQSFKTPSKKFLVFQDNPLSPHSNGTSSFVKSKLSSNGSGVDVRDMENQKAIENNSSRSDSNLPNLLESGKQKGWPEKNLSGSFSSDLSEYTFDRIDSSEIPHSGQSSKNSFDQNSFYDPYLEYNGMEMIARKCEFLQELKIWQCNDNTLESVCKCSNLQILHLMDSVPGLCLSSVSDWGLILLSESCKRLMELNLGGGSIGYEGLSAIGKNCQIISKLIVCNKEFRKGWLRALSHFTMLETLCFENCHKIDLDPGPIEKLGNCFSIGRLQFLNCDLGDHHGFASLMRMCSPTKEIEFRDCWRLTDDILFLITSMKNLRILQIDGCSLITSKGLENVLMELPSIQVLKILFCEKIIEKEVSTKLSIRLSNLKKLIWQPQSGGDNLKPGQKITFGSLI